MTAGISIEQSLKQMSKRLERVEKVNRLMKVWGAITIAALIAAGPFASNVIAKPQPKAVTASAFNLESSGKTVATLGMFNGKPNLAIFDSTGKIVVAVGIDGAALPTGHAAGIAVYDGNEDIPGAGKIRASLGVTPSGPSAGVGDSTYDGNGVIRSADGSAIDGSAGYFETFDPNGSVAGITDDDKTFHQQGFFANDLNGKNRVFAGNSLDGTTFNIVQTSDPNGSATGIIDNDNSQQNQGFFANDLNGKNRVFVGNSLDGTSFEQISFNDSKGNFAGLLGTNGTISPDIALVLADPSGTYFAGENLDGAGVDWALFDTNSKLRAFGDFDGSNESVDLFSPTSVLVGHLP